MDIRTMAYVNIEEMDSVFDSKTGTYTPEGLYIYFLSHESEVVYFVEDGIMKGVISIGDLQRYYENGEKELPINNHIFFVKGRNSFNRAKFFFKEHLTVNEIPCISEKKELQGIIRYEKEGKIRDEQRKSLKTAYKHNWQQREILRFIKYSHARVFLCSMEKRRVDENLNARARKIRNDRWKREVENGNRRLTEKEWKDFWGKDWYAGIEEDLKNDISNLEIRNVLGKYEFNNFEGKIFHFYNGVRKTFGQVCEQAVPKRKLYMYGPCIVAGRYCRDDQTIASHLQKMLSEARHTGWHVLNEGFCGQVDCINRAFMEPLSKDDIVVIIMEKEWLPVDYYKEHGIDFTDVFIDDDICKKIVDAYFHCNGEINRKIAAKIFEGLNKADLFHDQRTGDAAVPIQNYYIPWDINQYFYEYFIEHKLQVDDKKTTGAAVMNCNPFTRGHRHMIERALEYVDRLYVFVVEEDKSYFSFEDRLEMVRTGVEDLKDVIVVPSGKYILSNDTFSQYFEKEQVETVESMDYDLYIFAEVFARKLNITYRFVGEEPFDMVTREYNNTMKRILPRFGIDVIEFPRKRMDKSEKVISATEVRTFIAEQKYDELKELIPESTMQYLTINGYLSY